MQADGAAASQTLSIESVLVTGATGFVGRAVIRELLSQGLKPICLVRSPSKLHAQHPDVTEDRMSAIAGSLAHKKALQQAADLSQAVIHLVGIIIQRRLRGQTFRRVHVAGTDHVVSAAQRAGIRRFVHMSALGSRPDAPSRYHRTKWQAETAVRQSELHWTIFRPSLIHGPHGEFMSLMRRFAVGLVPPVVPYFGDGQSLIQPVSVKNVARCVVSSLSMPATIGQTYPMGGPKTYTWIDFYKTCRRLIPQARLWKPLVSLPVPLAKVVAALSAPPMALAELVMPSIGQLRFDAGQVDMAQEDSVCDHTIAERVFDVKMRSFEDELSLYADAIA